MRRLPRRRFLIAAGSLLVARNGAQGQARAKPWRIGYLSGIAASDALRNGFAPIADELARRGVREGPDYVVEYRGSNRDRSLLPRLAMELVALRVDVIVADLPPEILAARDATKTIPIVMKFGMVPKELGLIQSLARPGGNVTGTLLQSPESTAKIVQIMRDVLGRGASVAVMYQPDYPGLALYNDDFREAATRAGLRLTMRPVSTEAQLEAVLDGLARDRPRALFLSPTGVLGRQTDRILQFAAVQRLPAIYSTRWPVELGALLAWEADLADLQVQTAAIVEKILKGANPADIPVEEPKRFSLWINARTADALGIAIPRSILLQADRVLS